MATAKLLQPNVGKVPAYPLAGAFESENVSGKVNIKESLETIKSSLIGGIKDAMKEVTTEIKNISPKKSDSKSSSSSNSYESLINIMEDKLSSKFDFFKPITKAAKELRGESKDGKGSKEAKELLDIEKQQTNYTKALLKETTIIRLLVEKIAKVKYDPRAKGAQFRDDAGKFVKLGATGKELKPFGPSVSSAQTPIQQKTTAATEQKKVEQAAAQQQPMQEAESDSGLGLSDMLSAGWKGVKTAGKAIAKGALSLGKGAARFMGSTAGKVLGATAAVGMGAYTAYKGWTGAEEDKQAKLEEIDAAVKSGEITPQEAEAQKKQVADQTTEKKSGAAGEGTGMAAGAIAGAKLGATVGTFIGGPIGTGVGALAGGALGAVAGSTVGRKIGEYGGKAINAIGNFFSGTKSQMNTGVSGSLEYQNMENTVLQRAKEAGAVDASGNIIDDKKYNEIRKQVRDEVLQKNPNANVLSEQKVAATEAFNQQEISGAGGTTTAESLNKGVSAQKTFLGSETLGALFSSKGVKTGQVMLQGSQSSEDPFGGRTNNRQEFLGERISGGLFGKDTFKVNDSEGKQVEVTKKTYMKLAEMAKDQNFDPTQIQSIIDADPLNKTKSREITATKNKSEFLGARGEGVSNEAGAAVSVSPGMGRRGVSDEIAKTSSDNTDLQREASRPIVTPIISNNNVQTNKQEIVPIKASPRSDSSFTRYMDRAAAW